jgi:hypothetical protein
VPDLARRLLRAIAAKIKHREAIASVRASMGPPDHEASNADPRSRPASAERSAAA